MDLNHDHQVELAVAVVVAYVGQHHVPTGDLPALIRSVHGAVVSLGVEALSAELVFLKPTQREIDISVGRDGIVSFIDGKTYKSLKRHLTAHDLTPDGYRARYGLPAAYPMVAASYSEKRSALAKQAGLGRSGAALHAVA